MVTENTLWDYADNLLSAQERQAVEIAIANDPTLRTQLDEILQFQQNLSQQTLDQPNANLSQHILQAWAQEQASATEFKANYRPLYVIATFVGVVTFALLIIAARSINPIEITLPSFDFSNQLLLISTEFLTAIVAILFIDKLIKYRQHVAV